MSLRAVQTVSWAFCSEADVVLVASGVWVSVAAAVGSAVFSEEDDEPSSEDPPQPASTRHAPTAAMTRRRLIAATVQRGSRAPLVPTG